MKHSAAHLFDTISGTPIGSPSNFLLEADVKRKGSQEGTLQQRDGKWIAHFSEWRTTGGRLEWARTSRTIGKASEISERKANAALAVIVDEANRRAKQPFVLMTLGEFIEKRFEPAWVGTKAARGKEHYRYMLDRFIKPGIGHIAIDDLNVDRVQTFLSAQLDIKVERSGKPLSIQTVHHIKNALSAVFSHMERLDLWTKVNPCRKVILPELRNAKRVAFTERQVEALAGELQRAGYPATALLILLLAWTGLRISEAVALRWKWVNLSEIPVQVESAWLLPKQLFVATALSHGEWSDGKSGARSAGIVDHVRDALIVHRANSKWSGDEQFVFSGRTGVPLDEHNELQRHVKPALKAAGLPNIGWHDLRHTWQTLAHGKGLSPEERMTQLGHRDPKMGALYTHVNVAGITQKLESNRVETLDGIHKPKYN